MSYHLEFNTIDYRWKVLDNQGFVFGDGETRDDALNSAKLVGITRDEVEL